MNLIKKLISKEWFSFFIGSIIIFTLLMSVGNIVSGLLRSNVSAREVLFNHLIDLPNSMKMIFPISSMVATMFALSKLQNSNQLSAIFSIGYSRFRFSQDLFSCSIASAIVIFLILGFARPLLKQKKDILIPEADSKFRNLKGQGLRSSTIGSGKIWFKNNDYFFSFTSYDRQRQLLFSPSLIYFKSSAIEKQIFADSAQSLGENHWIFNNVRIFENLNNGDFPVLKTEKDVTITLSETPTEFRQMESDITTLTMIPLFNYLRSLSTSGINVDEYFMLFFEPFATALTCVLMAFISITPIFSPNRRSASFGKSIFQVFIVAICFWLSNSYFEELGKSSQVSPFVASLLIPIFLSLFITMIYFRNREIK